MPPLYRMVLVLHDMEGLSTAEVARVTGVREGTVRVRLHRGRLMLRQQLARMAQTKPKVIVVDKIHATAEEEPPKRPRHCREMFAATVGLQGRPGDGRAQSRNGEAPRRL